MHLDKLSLEEKGKVKKYKVSICKNSLIVCGQELMIYMYKYMKDVYLKRQD